MRKLFNAILGLMLMTMAGVPLAYAGCMDDAGDAVAAFFTGGASLAICQTVETVQSMIRTVQTVMGSMERITRETIRTAKQSVDDTANSMVNNTNRAMRQIDHMVADANRMAGAAQRRASANRPIHRAKPAVQAQFKQPSLSGVQQANLGHKQQNRSASSSSLQQQSRVRQPLNHAEGTQALADSTRNAPANEIRDTMRQAADMMSHMQSDLANHAVRQIRGAANQARHMAERHVGAASRIAESSVMAPLRQLKQMLQDLVAHPERIFDPTSMVNESVERITRAMTQVTEQIHHEIMSEALATIGDVDQQLQRLTGDSRQAERIHQAMARLERQKDQLSLRALRQLVGSPASPAPAPSLHKAAGKLKRNLVSTHMQDLMRPVRQAGSNPFSAYIRSLKRDNLSLNKTRRLAASGRLQPGIQKRAQAAVDRMVKNKSPAQVRTIRLRLKQRLSRQVHGNPRALAEINRHFDRRFANLANVSGIQNKPVRLLPAIQPVPAMQK